METLDNGGFRINVHSERNFPESLVSILETFEELGLEVLDARVSCADSFHLEAVGEVSSRSHIFVVHSFSQTLLRSSFCIRLTRTFLSC